MKLNGHSKMNAMSSWRFMTLGAVVPHSSNAGEFEAFTKRWWAFTGMENKAPFSHSNCCDFA